MTNDREAYDEQQDRDVNDVRVELADYRFEEVRLVPGHRDGEVPEADILDEMDNIESEYNDDFRFEEDNPHDY